MKPRGRSMISTSLLFMAAASLVACGGAEPASPPTEAEVLYGADEKPLGRTYQQWSEAWYKWALAIPQTQSPLGNGPCDTNQSGDVFFLSGNAGGSSWRTCNVPAGKSVFFPIVNVTVRACPELVSASYTCQMATSAQAVGKSATSTFDTYSPTMSLKVDGTEYTGLSQRRAASPTFDDPTKNKAEDAFGSKCSGPIGANPCGVMEGAARIGAGDGYWVMLKPMSPGTHDVRFTAKLVFSPQQSFELSVAYFLNVQP